MSIGYVVISVCATMPDRTCAERFAGVPIAYGLLALQWTKNVVDFLAQIVYNRISNGAVMILTALFLFQEVIL